MELIILVVSFVVILAGAELFTNGIEWFGHKLGLAEGAVGSVLAAVGTALPETMIPIIAILFASGEHSEAVGVGAILGAPFMLATLAMFVTGLAVLAVSRRRAGGDTMLVDTAVLAHDMRYFAIAYGLAIAAAFLPLEPVALKWIVAVCLVCIYGWYVKGHFETEAGDGGPADLAPLRMHRLDVRGKREEPAVPRLRVVNVQVIAALGLIVLGAVAFVGAVEGIAETIGVDEVLLALVIAPIATELPEKFNSVLWVRAGKDTLAMGNITGAMVFQATIPTFVALVFAPLAWQIGAGSYTAFASAGIAFLASAAIFIPMARSGRLRGRNLLIGGVFYLLYLGLVVGVVTGIL
ncbi:MAG: sodium:calcium antiporter [Chloroflexi bacterium]|nr:sodium:calcium antiporter [Chloroflexota bacterium]